jgi:hypothetical protein
MEKPGTREIEHANFGHPLMTSQMVELTSVTLEDMKVGEWRWERPYRPGTGSPRWAWVARWGDHMVAATQDPR